MSEFDPRIGDVQKFLQEILKDHCKLQELPPYTLFLGHIDGVSGFCDTELRVLHISRAKVLEEQLKLLWHEIFHLETYHGCHGKDIYTIQEWWNAQDKKLYRAFHNTILCPHEQYADTYGERLGQDLNIDQIHCNHVVSFLQRWERNPELIYRIRPALQRIEWFVQLVEENFRVRL